MGVFFCFIWCGLHSSYLYWDSIPWFYGIREVVYSTTLDYPQCQSTPTTRETDRDWGMYLQEIYLNESVQCTWKYSGHFPSLFLDYRQGWHMWNGFFSSLKAFSSIKAILLQIQYCVFLVSRLSKMGERNQKKLFGSNLATFAVFVRHDLGNDNDILCW